MGGITLANPPVAKPLLTQIVTTSTSTPKIDCSNTHGKKYVKCLSKKHDISVGAIIGIVVASVVVLGAFIAWLMGWWCFASKSSGDVGLDDYYKMENTGGYVAPDSPRQVM